mgnify:CR=1 FL=1
MEEFFLQIINKNRSRWRTHYNLVMVGLHALHMGLHSLHSNHPREGFHGDATHHFLSFDFVNQNLRFPSYDWLLMRISELNLLILTAIIVLVVFSHGWGHFGRISLEPGNWAHVPPWISVGAMWKNHACSGTHFIFRMMWRCIERIAAYRKKIGGPTIPRGSEGNMLAWFGYLIGKSWDARGRRRLPWRSRCLCRWMYDHVAVGFVPSALGVSTFFPDMLCATEYYHSHASAAVGQISACIFCSVSASVHLKWKAAVSALLVCTWWDKTIAISSETGSARHTHTPLLPSKRSTLTYNCEDPAAFHDVQPLP